MLTLTSISLLEKVCFISLDLGLDWLLSPDSFFLLYLQVFESKEDTSIGGTVSNVEDSGEGIKHDSVKYSKEMQDKMEAETKRKRLLLEQQEQEEQERRRNAVIR